MKPFAYLLGMAVMLAASCSVQDNLIPISHDEYFYFSSFEQPTGDGTKVYVNENLLLRWTKDDRVSIFNKNTFNQQYQFTGNTGANAGSFKKVVTDEFVTGNPIDNVVSVYPYMETTEIAEDGLVSLILPSEQVYADNTFGLGANTMVSVSSDNLLQFKNLGGYLVFKLFGDGVSISSITLKGNDGEKLAGTAFITMPLDGVPVTELANNATTEITLQCSTPVRLGATAEESTPFWFVVPPMMFSRGLTVTVKDDKNGVFEKETTKSLEISRSKMTKMAAFEVQPTQIVIHVEEVILSPSSIILYPGQTTALIATIKPSNATDNSLIWSSSDRSVAEVVDGTVTALKTGTAIITATSYDGNHKATCEVIVNNPGQLEDPTEENGNW